MKTWHINTLSSIFLIWMFPATAMAEDRPYFPNSDGLTDQSWVEVKLTHLNRDSEVDLITNGAPSLQSASDASDVYSLNFNRQINDSISASASLIDQSFSNSTGSTADGFLLRVGLYYQKGPLNFQYDVSQVSQNTPSDLQFWDNRLSINWENDADTVRFGGSVGTLLGHPDVGNVSSGDELHLNLATEADTYDLSFTTSVGHAVQLITSETNGVRSTTVDDYSFTSLGGYYLRKFGMMSLGLDGSVYSYNSQTRPDTSTVGIVAQYELSKALFDFRFEQQTTEALQNGASYAPRRTSNISTIGVSVDLGSGVYGNAIYSHEIGSYSELNGLVTSTTNTKSNSLSLAITKIF